MMKRIGNRLTGVVILLLAISTNIALGAVTATVDRNRVTLGDTLRLTITATDDEDIDEGALRALQNDFDILQRSTSSNTSIINGRVSQTRQMIVDLAPRREGDLQIPSMQFEQSVTPGITVTVGPASDTPNDGQNVVVEAELDKREVYVQGQVILTLRVLESINIESRNLSPLELDNAFVKPLEQHAYQRVINGRQWLVHEVRYAIFPEQSGTLQIPAQVFSGRVDQGRRSFFDLGGGGQLVRRTTQPVTITVLPKPADYPPQDWLPAEQLTLQETWSTPPEQLRVGESATRTIRIVGEGLQGAQLPPILFTPPDGLKYYPDQPSISEQEIASGLEGIREDSAAVVPTRAGTYTIPEIRIPWWNTKTGELEYAVVPQREITAVGTAPVNAPPPPDEETSDAVATPAPDSAIDSVFTATPLDVSAAQGQLRIWQTVAAVSLLGWLLTLLYLWRRRAHKPPAKDAAADNPSEKHAFKTLIDACEQNSTKHARAAVVAWAATIMPGTTAVSLEQVGRALGDEEFAAQLAELDAALYRPEQISWNGGALLAGARRVRSDISSGQRSSGDTKLQLYPSTG